MKEGFDQKKELNWMPRCLLSNCCACCSLEDKNEGKGQ